MAAGVASNFSSVQLTEWNVSKNHHQCACHVIALILGAGLRALQLSKWEVVNPVSDEEQDIDPDDAEEAVLEPGWEQNGDEDNYVESNQPGIGFTLKKVTMKEWEDVNTLNLILKKKEAAAASAPLEPMFGPMLKTLKKYIDLAINCDTVVITTFLHPAWRLMLFKKDFPSKSIRIESLVGRVFQQREALIKSAEIVTPPTKASQSENDLTKSDSESEADDYNFYPPDLKAISVNTELERQDGSTAIKVDPKVITGAQS
ncbi:hypothetical protein H4Q26_018037 [Puccinia striiformis f. sp. tritici PST-130]|nr:hypothetical protein H4Q26_018037 [Puccinia striiformis f. sp. tritici PST-130]